MLVMLVEISKGLLTLKSLLFKKLSIMLVY